MNKVIIQLIRCFTLLLFNSLNLVAQTGGLVQTSKSPFIKLKNINIGDVKWTGGFWKEKTDECEQVMIPYMGNIYMQKALKNFKVAGKIEQGEFWGSWWHDGDFYKWVEALVISYANTKDEQTGKQIDEIISVIAKAQEPDGYINTAIQIGHGTLSINFTDERPYKNTGRWQSEREHEMYNMGHLFTLASLHHRVTGKKTLLDVAIKAADYLTTIFNNPTPKLASLIFNPPQIMGLVELYRSTGNKKYLQLANTFLNMKGMMKEKRIETQDHLPVRAQTEALGHAVTGIYLYAGMADVYAETGDTALMNVLNKLWADAVYKKMYITGGMGSYHNNSIKNERIHEAFGAAYDLPNATAYSETCANIANAMWNWRMLALTSDSKYADVMEQVFYNSLLSSISIDGKSYFYTNLLRFYGKNHQLLSSDSYHRWNLPRGGICCPTSTVRTIEEMSNYAYSINDKGVWVNLYGSNTLNTELPNGNAVSFTQTTNYPWDEDVKIVCEASIKNNISLMLRIPAWAKGATLHVNGKPIADKIIAGEYFGLNRKWAKGDVVELHLPMKVQLVEAHAKVEANINQVAIQRGPIVYCLEQQDVTDTVALSNLKIPSNIQLTPVYKKELLGGITVLQGVALKKDAVNYSSNTLYMQVENDKLKQVKIQLIPYYAWNNRGLGEMAVWLPAQ